MKRSLAAPTLIKMAAVTALAAALAGCSTGSTSGTEAAAEPTSTTSVDPDAFPVTIEHALGTTTIESEPRRVATLGWVDQDHALSVGVVPVGAIEISWGGNEQLSTPWFDEALEELGGEQPTRYSDADGAPVEEIARLAPDLILATNSGVTAKEYQQLSKVAPVVAKPTRKPTPTTEADYASRLLKAKKQVREKMDEGDEQPPVQ